MLSAFTGWGVEYTINYPLDTKIASNNRSLNRVLLNSSAFGGQAVAINQGVGGLLYTKASPVFVAAPGETVSATFDWSGSWMHGYVYLDRGNDGEFSCTLGTNSAIPAGSDVMTFSNCNGYNSAGVATNDGNVGVNPPQFVIPSDLAPGLYQMRYKVDWNSINPGGSNGDPQYIDKNGGAIADVRVYVMPATAPAVSVTAENGSVTLSNGKSVTLQNIQGVGDVTLKLTPKSGYVVSKLIVESGNELPEIEGVVYANGVKGASRLEVPGVLITNNQYTVPAANLLGNVKITALFERDSASAGEDYECEYSGSLPEGEGFETLTVGGSDYALTGTNRHYFAENVIVPVELGTASAVKVGFKGGSDKVSLSIDLDQSGSFSAAKGECVVSGAGGELGSFSLPEGLKEGVYRARLEAAGHSAVDFLVDCYKGVPKIRVRAINGLALSGTSQPLPNTLNFGETLKARVNPAIADYEAGAFVVRYGHNLQGEQFVKGNQQWYEEEVSDLSNITLNPGKLHGDLMIMGEFHPGSESMWVPIWSDEFEGSSLDTEAWSYHPRYSATWNKRVAQGDEIPFVNKFEDGSYKSYSIPTPSQFSGSDSQPIITGAIYSYNKVHMKGGRIEARLRTRAHSGNFPAFWLMPQDGSAGWPKCGEIDIWEQINTSTTTYHTIHSGWTYKSFGTVSKSSPTSSGSSSADPNLWHVYALEWDALNQLRWYLDGKLVFTYSNSHFSEGSYTEAITWPFNKPFYIILNQSVGDGSWAAAGDATFEYLTEFDYVRCYQRKDALSYYTKKTGNVTAVETVIVSPEDEGTSRYYTLDGIEVSGGSLRPGIYMERRGGSTKKILVK